MTFRLLCILAFFLPTLAAAETAKPKTKPEEKFTWSDLLPRAMQKNPRLNVAIHTEATAAGKKLPPPTPEKPAYYFLMDGGLYEGGDPVAGDRPPTPAGLAEVMKSSLAASGYRLATAEQPPTLVIRYFWGVYNHLTPIDPETTVDLADPLFMKNVGTRATLVGGPDFAGKLIRAMTTYRMDFFRLEDPRHDEMVSLALGDLYFVFAAGFQPDAAGKKELIWTTVICTDSYALTMREALPALVGMARTYFGHETEPTLVHPRLYGGRVEIGEPVVVPEGARK